MSSKLEFTGERFTPECEREIWYEHMHRYAFAASLCAGKVVLDAACGEGYGAALLAREARQVTGLDLSQAAIEHARKRYQGQENLVFEIGDCTRLPFADDSFERVVSFETLEHLDDHDGMLSEFARVLRPGGLLVLSSPDRAVYTDELGNANEHHVRELDRAELEALLARHFPACRLLGQRLAFHSLIFPLDAAREVVLQRASDGACERLDRVALKPVYLIALCATEAGALPPPDHAVWLLDDAEDSVYRHYHGEIRRNMAAGGIIAERDREIERLRGRLESAGAPVRGWLARWFGKG